MSHNFAEELDIVEGMYPCHIIGFDPHFIVSPAVDSASAGESGAKHCSLEVVQEKDCTSA